jgi:predicted membrane protein
LSEPRVRPVGPFRFPAAWGCAAAAPAYAFAMNKKFIIAWVALLVVWLMGSFVVHGVLLRPDYMQLTDLFRTQSEQQTYFPLMILAHVILSGAFVWIYARGVEAKPWLAQGVRYGIAVALLTSVPTYMIYFVVQPMPGAVVIKQIVLDSVLLVVLGTIVAWLYRRPAA